MMTVAVLAGLASAQAATGVDQKSGVAVSPVGQTLLQGTVTGGGTADVTVFWGPADGGTTPAKWAHKQVLKDVTSDTPFAITAEPLVFGITYNYRCQISSGGNAVWAAAATTFTGAKPRVAAQRSNNAPILPVTSSLVCWYDAAVGVTVNAKGAVETWKDLSGNEYHGLPCMGVPTLAANQINGKPAVQFRSTAGPCALNCNGPFFSESQYVVLRSPSATWSNDGSFLGRRWSLGSSHRLSKNTTAFCDQFPTAVSKNGKPITEVPFNLAPITDFMILKINANDLDMSRNIHQIGMGDGASCDLDIAEIIAYQSRLSASDEAGTVTVQDAGTTEAPGMMGPSRHFSGVRGMNGGGIIRTYPFASTSHTTEAWFKADKFNSSLIRWGRGNLANLRLLSTPAHFAITNCWGSPIQQATSVMEKNQWIHVAYTFSLQGWMIYVNGRPDMPAVWNHIQEIATPVELQIGDGFAGDLDEVRVSNVLRSADWIKLPYENQKPVQTVVGPLIQPGKEFTVSEKSVTLAEGNTLTLTAKAGGAQKISWSIVRDGKEALVAIDRFNYTLAVGRVTGDQAYILRFKAVFADGVKKLDIPVTIREDIPDPVYTLKTPTNWDGRETITLQPQITNLPALQAKGGGELSYEWTFPPLLEMKSIEPWCAGTPISSTANPTPFPWIGGKAMIISPANGSAAMLTLGLEQVTHG